MTALHSGKDQSITANLYKSLYFMACPASLIFFNIVEFHYPDRVTRQFDFAPTIPDSCDTSVTHHVIDTKPESRCLIHCIINTFANRNVGRSLL